MTVIRGPWLHDAFVVRTEKTLCGRQLRHDVLARLRQGHRHITVDLAQLETIDAAGIGELVRVYNVASAMNASVRIVNASPWVQKILELVELFDRLSGGRRYGLPITPRVNVPPR